MTRVLWLAVGCLGLSAMLAQLTLMRELLCAFSGNELVFGIVLGNWMLLTGIGSALGRRAASLKSPLAALVAVQVLLAVLPIVDVFVLRTLRNVVFVRGVEIGVTDSVVCCFVILAPYCLAVGYGLTLASLILASEKDAAGIGRVYFLDNAGMVVGGALFTFALVQWLDHFAILYFSALLNLLLAGVVASRCCGRAARIAVWSAAAAVVALAAGVNLDALSTAAEFAPQHVACRACSPYGRLIVTESAGQYNFMENGVALFSSNDVQRVEESVHFALAQRPRARRVLLVSGGASGTAREVLKYGVAAVDYVELDPEILAAAREISARKPPRPAHPSDQRRRPALRQRDPGALRRCHPRRARSLHVATESLLHAGIFRRGPPHPGSRRGAGPFPGPLRGLPGPGHGPRAGRRSSDAERSLCQRVDRAGGGKGPFSRLRRRADGRHCGTDPPGGRVHALGRPLQHRGHAEARPAGRDRSGPWTPMRR